jgi:hypothetical protein
MQRLWRKQRKLERVLVLSKSNVGPDDEGIGYWLQVTEVGNGIVTSAEGRHESRVGVEASRMCSVRPKMLSVGSERVREI